MIGVNRVSHRLCTLTFGTVSQRLVIAGVIAAAEGVSLEFDNLLIAAVVMGSWVLLGREITKDPMALF